MASASTYRILLKQLLELSEEDLDCDITLYTHDGNEFCPVKMGISKEGTDGVLDEGHPYIYYKFR